jgi:hypothetical protein
MATPTTLPATFVAGNILEASQLNAVRGAFRVLQVVQGTTTTPVTNSTNVYTATGLTATITPSATSSKILCLVQQNGVGKDNNTYCDISLFRGATNISAFGLFAAYTGNADSNYVGTTGVTYLDSPNTTAATTYSTSFLSGAGVAIARVQNSNSMSTIILMEISA